MRNISAAQEDPDGRRNPVRSNDWLIKPDNAVITFIDYRPDQYAGVHSMQHEELLRNGLTLAKVSKDFNLPVVLLKSCARCSATRPNSTAPRSILGKPPNL